jgi:ATP-binding cassette subfamily B protein
MIRESDHPLTVPEGPVTVGFSHVDFTYPGAEDVSLASLEAVARLERVARTPVLHDLTFEVQPGTMTALVGPSGAGKTTTSLLISRLYDVTAGSVTLNGVDVRDLSFASLRDTVGVVTQDVHLFHETLGANLRFARPDATDEEIFDALRAAQIYDMVAELPQGLDTVVGERGYRLSGGEKQRVALARLLLKAPRVVVLDEATAHLDAESEAAVQRALDATMAERTSIVIAHRLSTIRNADQILVIEAGRVAQRGTHEELYAQGGLYRDLYETQFASQES